MEVLNGGFLLFGFVNGLFLIGLMRSGSFGSFRALIFLLIMGELD